MDDKFEKEDKLFEEKLLESKRLENFNRNNSSSLN